MKIGNEKAKYAVPLYNVAHASVYVGTVYCDTKEEYDKLVNDNYNELQNSGHFAVNVHNNFDLSDSELDESETEGDNFDKNKKYWENT